MNGKLDLGFADLGPQKVKNLSEPVPTEFNFVKLILINIEGFPERQLILNLIVDEHLPPNFNLLHCRTSGSMRNKL